MNEKHSIDIIYRTSPASFPILEQSEAPPGGFLTLLLDAQDIPVSYSPAHTILTIRRLLVDRDN
jgi:hypothetical protein